MDLKELYYTTFGGIRKNANFVMYLRGAWWSLIPRSLTRGRLTHYMKLVESLPTADRERLERRVEYCCKLDEYTPLPDNARLLKDHVVRKMDVHSAYFFDTFEYTRYFPAAFRWLQQDGDVTWLFDWPTVVKSRPIAGDNRNSVLINQDKTRHFLFVKDPFSWEEKENRVIFRGDIYRKPHRFKFLQMYSDNPMCDLKDTSHKPGIPSEWQQQSETSIYKHLKYKYIMSLEGNDVASNLKWVMSSNSIAVMPRPKYETWYMEGTLIPDYHYIEIKDDYSDFEEKINYYNNHPDEAKAIIRNANEYAAGFRNLRFEKLTALATFDRYFKFTNRF